MWSHRFVRPVMRCAVMMRTVENYAQLRLRTISCKAPLIVGGTDLGARDFTSSSTYRTEQKTFSTQGEKQIHDTLVQKFPEATEVEVKDISGGCGSMYEIYITSSEVRDMRYEFWDG